MLSSTSRIWLTAAAICVTFLTGETAIVSVLKDGHMTWDDRSSAEQAEEVSAEGHVAEHNSDAEESSVSSTVSDSELSTFLHKEGAKESSEIGYGHIASMIQQEMHESSGEQDGDLALLLELFQKLSEDNATDASSSLLQEGDQAEAAAAAFLQYVQRVYSNLPVDTDGAPPKGIGTRTWEFFIKAHHNLKDVRSGIGNQVASVAGLVLGPNSCILKYFFMFFTLDGEDDYPYFPSACGVSFQMTSV